jgi:hypothetical protein
MRPNFQPPGIDNTVLPARFLNQSGALVNVYTDGSVLLSHGGTEMGQGLHTKMVQVASQVLKSKINPKVNPISYTWLRVSCFKCDGFSAIQFFPFLLNIGLVI